MNASMVVHHNPLVTPLAGLPAPVGTRLQDLAPATAAPLMLRVNGAWLLRADWWRPVFEGDVIEWHVLPMGGNGGGSRAVLMLIAAIAIAYFTFGTGTYALGLTGFQGAATSLVLNVAASALINALVPIQSPSLGNVGSPGSVYSVATAGNQARLAQPIPVIYGRMLTFPDYAAQPYSEYDALGDQYFFAVYCIGQGSFNVERLQIDDTPLDHFSDVQYEVLAPGSLPTLAKANVVTAPEVSGQELQSGKRVGGYAACGPKYVADKIGVDIIWPRGLGLADDSGNLGNLSASFQIDARFVDDFGAPGSAWFLIGSETVTRATNTPVRLSFLYDLPAPGRVEVRATRSDLKNTSNNALHDMIWGALRAYLSAAAPLAATATHMAIRIRASEQLSGLSQRKISGIWRRKLRTWSAGVWSAPVETRNPMWARLDKLTNTVYGDGLADSRIDLQTHADLAAVYDARQDHLDILFDSKVTSIDADRTICQAGRAVPFMRAGVCTVARDQLQTLPVTAFTSRDILPGSMSIGYALATEVTADALIVEYFDNRSWDWREITCKAPGVVTPANPIRQRIMGITGATHAQREGLYLAAQNVYRRKFPTFSTEMQGLLPAFGSAVLFHPALPGWGQTGDVAFWDSVNRIIGLTEQPVFTPAALHYVSFRRDDGSVTPAIPVTPGPGPFDLQLSLTPTLADGVTPMHFHLADPTRERPKFVFGAAGQHRIVARVLGISKKGKGKDGATTIEIKTVAEDVRVHQVDNALLPGPGDVQDPVDGGSAGGGDTGGGLLFLTSLTDHLIDSAQYPTAGALARFTLGSDGTCYGTEQHGLAGPAVENYPNEWMLFGGVENAVAALYEARFTFLGGWGSAGGGGNYSVGALIPPTGGDALDTWLNLGTTRTVELALGSLGGRGDLDAATAVVRVEIRLVGGATIQSSQTVTLHTQINPSGNAP